MGRYANYPTTIEDCLTFRLKSLTENNNCYLTSYGIRKGITSWSSNGQTHSKISILVNHSKYETYIIFDYSCNGQPKNYRVNLISKISNLGKGKIWFFICPITGELCRKLYLHDGCFLHRKAFRGLMYQKQLESKKNRELHKIFDAFIVGDEVYDELYSKYFKTHYKGKPTKRYLKLQNKIDASKSFSTDTLQRLLLV